MDPTVLYVLLAITVLALAFCAYRLYTRSRFAPAPLCPACPIDPTYPLSPLSPLPHVLDNATAANILAIARQMYSTGCQCTPGDVVDLALTNAQLAALTNDRAAVMQALYNPMVDAQIRSTLARVNNVPAQVYLVTQVRSIIGAVAYQNNN